MDLTIKLWYKLLLKVGFYRVRSKIRLIVNRQEREQYIERTIRESLRSVGIINLISPEVYQTIGGEIKRERNFYLAAERKLEKVSKRIGQKIWVHRSSIISRYVNKGHRIPCIQVRVGSYIYHFIPKSFARK